MSRHPADETLAEFADGKLNGRARRTMIEHLASCDDCRSIYDVIADAQDADVIDRYAPIPGNFGKVAIGTLAVAAAATIVFFTPPVQERVAAWRTGGVSEIVELTKSSPQRRIEGRLAGDFVYGEFTTYRNANEKKVDYEQMQLEQAATEVRSSRAKGLALLLAGKHDEAIAELNRAIQRAGADDPILINDLAAAYLERSRFENNAPKDLPVARQLTEKAWSLSKTPEIAWNRALALQYAGDKDAEIAWNDYLNLDSTSKWAQEVRDEFLDRDL